MENVSKIEWWTLEKFQGRFNRITSHDERNGHVFVEETTMAVPDSEIVCDQCNEEIKTFPCPVVVGHALCGDCRILWHIHDGDTEYFETLEYNAGMVDSRPGVTHGGRRS
jgi:hypothetical protein